jgi:tetratricopeptide (TPR) repeat protein
MGAHAEHEEILDPVTRAYNDLMNAGKDFQKIELYAYAIKKYKEALEVRPYDKDANTNINECRSRLQHDNKIIAVIAVVAVVAVGIFLLV